MAEDRVDRTTRHHEIIKRVGKINVQNKRIEACLQWQRCLKKDLFLHRQFKFLCCSVFFIESIFFKIS